MALFVYCLVRHFEKLCKLSLFSIHGLLCSLYHSASLKCVVEDCEVLGQLWAVLNVEHTLERIGLKLILAHLNSNSGDGPALVLEFAVEVGYRLSQ